MRLLVSDGDRAPQGLKGYQYHGRYHLAFSNEASNTTSVFNLGRVPEPGSLALAGLTWVVWRCTVDGVSRAAQAKAKVEAETAGALGDGRR